ncbi:MAG: SHOCT domain-containing protein [Deltaproteobacteria bacterium]|nr:SHOCT domain-containing protein [Deltaproteobacteria bacterium]
MSIADELGKLNELRQSGAITEDEYQEAKEAILAENQSALRANDGEVWPYPCSIKFFN